MRFPGYCALIFALLATSSLAARWKDERETHAHHQALSPCLRARVQSICTTLLGPQETVDISAFASNALPAGSTNWAITCSAPDRDVNFLFERKSGDLILCSQTFHDFLSNKGTRRALPTARAATAAAHAYLRALGIENAAHPCTLVGPPEERTVAWRLFFDQGIHRLSLSLSFNTGDLLLLTQSKQINNVSPG